MDWIHEAAAGTYIPLLQQFDELLEEGYHPKATISISPVLAEQLSHAYFQENFVLHLNQRILAARLDERYFLKRGEKVRQATAQFWIDHYSNIKHLFLQRYEKNILKQLKRLREAGVLELITTAATHLYLPLAGFDENIRAQISIGIALHKKHFGVAPKGMWLPECAYRPHYRWKNPVLSAEECERKGIEEFLAEEGIEYFFTTSAMINGGVSTGFHQKKNDIGDWNYTIEDEQCSFSETKSPLEVYYVRSQLGNGKKVAVFTREPNTATQVWSGIMGYPGNPMYLEFHKKNFPGGHRYWRVTDSKLDLGKKQLYLQEKTIEHINAQAIHFVGTVNDVLQKHSEKNENYGVVCAPYDAELFGHWWFEGPKFLKKIFQEFEQQRSVNVHTISEVSQKISTAEVLALPEGSWGENGNHSVWLNDKTEWTWKIVYDAEQTFRNVLKEQFSHSSIVLERVLQQAARELLVLEASDWQFLITQKSAKDYAEERLLKHYSNFHSLIVMAKKILDGENLSDEILALLSSYEKRIPIFTEMDLNRWR
jgi:1,4-alpha-glucan branching enzyme